MPTYQYRCTQCGSELEAVQKFSDPALTECPECAGALRKIYNAVGVVFKGSGFYRTDSRAAATNGSSSNGEGSGSADGAAGGDKEKATKSESGSGDKGSSGAKESSSAQPKEPGAGKQPVSAGPKSSSTSG